jgi:hypothetical protein
VRLGFGERAELEALRAVVGPERCDRVRRGLAGAHGRNDERGPGGAQVLDERGRRRVEQLGVVHAEDERPPGGLPAQLLDGGLQQGEEVIGTHVSGHDTDERPQRHEGRAARRLHPRRGRAGARRRRERLPREARLADAGGPLEDDRGAALGPCARDPVEIGRTTDQGPGGLGHR